ncbi:hypothetical protein SM216_23970, partial [Salmonella enterica]|nr:hypothetical protein [Salmonella enterica]
ESEIEEYVDEALSEIDAEALVAAFEAELNADEAVSETALTVFFTNPNICHLYFSLVMFSPWQTCELVMRCRYYFLYHQQRFTITPRSRTGRHLHP